MVGRPLKYTPDELKARVDEYFTTETKVTLAGLAVFLEVDRQTIYNYKERDEFFDIIKRAVERVEARYEERLIYENSPTGVIFALKNMGWKDKTEVDQNHSGGLRIIIEDAEGCDPIEYETKVR
jgi:hypothetical protein